MDRIKTFVIFRKDGFYNDLIQYLESNNFPKNQEIMVYVDENIELEKNDYNIEQITSNLEDTDDVRKEIFDKLQGNDLAVICDTYFKLSEPIDFEKFTDTTFMLLKTNVDNISLPYLFCYNNLDNSDYDTFNQITYFDHDDNIYGDGIVHDNFLDTVISDESDDINSIILRFCFGDENKFLEDGKFTVNDEDDAIYPKLIKLFKSDELLYDDEPIKVAQDIISESHEYISTYYIFDKILDENGIIDNFLIAGLTTCKPEQNVFYYTGDIDALTTKYVRYFEKYYKSTFMIHIPDWIDKSLIPDELHDKYLSEIHVDKEIFDSNRTIILDFEKYRLNDTEISRCDDNFSFNDNTYSIFSPIKYDDKQLVATSTSPFIVQCIKDNKLIQIFDTKINIDEGLLFGNIVKFLSDYVGLLKIRDNCYKFQIFRDKTLEPKGTSNKFKIKNPIGLTCIDNELFILTKENNNIYKCKIDLVKYFTDICTVHDINSVYNIDIKIKNNVSLKIKDYNNITSDLCGLRFNYDEDYCAKVEYDYHNKILKYDDNYSYINKFVYMPSDIKTIEKTHSVYFYGDCSILDPLKNKFKDLSVTIGNSYESSKYCFIMQTEFERLNNLELSKIIDNNTIIVSVITKQQLDSGNFIKKFTADKILQKLFLFNIGMNDNYIQFVIEKIIMDEQYEKRQQFMNIDRQNIFNQSNIYHIIKNIKEGKFQKKLDDSNKSLANKIKKNIFDNDSSFNSLINFIVKKEFELEIRHLNTSIPECLKKLNLFGSNKSILEESSKFDIVVVSSIKDLKNIEVSDKEVFFYINDLNKILMT